MVRLIELIQIPKIFKHVRNITLVGVTLGYCWIARIILATKGPHVIPVCPKLDHPEPTVGAVEIIQQLHRQIGHRILDTWTLVSSNLTHHRG